MLLWLRIEVTCSLAIVKFFSVELRLVELAPKVIVPEDEPALSVTLNEVSRKVEPYCGSTIRCLTVIYRISAFSSVILTIDKTKRNHDLLTIVMACS